MKKKSIESIWKSNPTVSYVSKEEERIVFQGSAEARKYYAELEALIGMEAKVALQKYLSSQQIIADLERKNAFVSGFSFGVKLIVEGLEE